ncbi:phage minor structural protein [Metabacillus crassostreae]|uniref:phage tail spike protein n=1 Tax=Metabacillus crassostreae TaxID=929098 RepID=UPI0019576A5A|nr:phage tail spike protein [Metabacillus crassostreae]MBM7605978.1 phage minor structural protein [Metabacillus crassostreae]
MIDILDYKTEKIIGTLENKEETSLFWLDSHKQTLKGNLETFDFTMQANVKEAEYVSKRNRIIIPDEDGFFREFIIFETKQYTDLTKEVYTNASYTDLKKQKIIAPTTLENQTVSTVGQYVLADTGFKLGIVEVPGTRKIVFENHTDALEAIQMISTTFNCEVRFRVEVKGNRIIGRYVDFLQRVGGNKGKETELGKDLINITRKENTDAIVTALIVLGPEKEDGTRTIVSVKDEEALQRWGDKENRHLWAIYEPQTDADVTAARLTELGVAELNKRINTLIEYTVDAASIEHIFGYDHEKVRLGDTTRIKDTSFVPALFVEARVIEVDRSISNPSEKKYVLGDFIEYSEEEIMATFKKLQAVLKQKVTAGELQAVREYVNQQDADLYGDATHYADTVSGTAKQEAINESITYVDDQVAPIREKVNFVEVEVEKRELEIVKQDAIPTGTNYALGQLWIRTTDNAYHKWDGTSWVKFLPTLKELAEKAGLEYVNGQLLDKANKADTFTKTEVQNKLDAKVSTTTYTTDMQGIVTDIDNVETKVTQTEKDITLRATKEELSTTNSNVSELSTRLSTAESEINANAEEIQLRVTKNELENLKIGTRNLFIIANAKRNTALTWADGREFSESGSVASGFIASVGGERFICNYIISQLIFYDSNFVYLGSYTSNGVESGANSIPTSKFTVPNDSRIAYLRLGFRTNFITSSETIRDKEIMFEKGDKGTEWSLSPEDLEGDISGLESRIKNTESTIIQNAEQISLRVTKITYDTEINGSSGLKARINSAESAITQNAENINLKVNKDGVITSINVSPEEVQIESKRLLVGDFTNLCENPDFEGDVIGQKPRGYDGGRVVDISSWSNGNGSNKAMQIDATNGSNATAYVNNIISVKPGQKFYVEADARYFNTAGTGHIRIGFRRWDFKKQPLSAWDAVALWSSTKHTDFRTSSGVYTVPSGTGYIQLWVAFQNNGETTNKLIIDNIRVNRMSGAELIVAGSITAEKLNVNDLSAITGTFTKSGTNNKTIINGNEIRSETEYAYSSMSGGNLSIGTSGFDRILHDTIGIRSVNKDNVGQGAIYFFDDELFIEAPSIGSKVSIGGTLYANSIVSTKKKEGESLLKFNTDRPWDFVNESSGPSASLVLKSSTDSKHFKIKNSLNEDIISFYGSSSGNAIAFGARVNMANNFIDNAYITNRSHAFLSLVNGWIGYGSSHHQPRYTRDATNRVYLSGMASGGLVGSVIATLPIECRPSKAEEFPVITGGNVLGRVTVNPSGTIVLASGSTSYVSLSSISFLAEI